MGGCCDPRGCDDFFDNRFASRVARRYEQRGLDRNARRIVEFIERQGIEDATVLEIGGGVGEIQIELLKRGAAHAVNLELSSAYDAEALKLLRQHGLERRVERRLCDVAVDGGFVRPADVVVLHRVVCCYPDYVRLLTEVAQHSNRLVVFSHPPRNPVSRLAVAAAEPQAAAAAEGLPRVRAPAGGAARRARAAGSPPDVRPPRPRLAHPGPRRAR